MGPLISGKSRLVKYDNLARFIYEFDCHLGDSVRSVQLFVWLLAIQNESNKPMFAAIKKGKIPTKTT